MAALIGRPSAKRSRGLLRVSLAILVVTASGCARWINEPDLDRLSNAGESGPLRVFAADGTVYLLENVSVANDTLRGNTLERPVTRVALPTNAVNGVERRIETGGKDDPSRPVLILGLWAVGFAIAALLMQ